MRFLVSLRVSRPDGDGGRCRRTVESREVEAPSWSGALDVALWLAADLGLRESDAAVAAVAIDSIARIDH